MCRHPVDTVALQDGVNLIRILSLKVRLLADHFPDYFLLEVRQIGKSPAYNPVTGQGINVAAGLLQGPFQAAGTVLPL